MSEFADKALLPAGMCDVLPPEAENEALTTQRLMGALTAYGYEHVKPPLIEFEDSLLTGNGAAMAEQTLRLPDPVSQKMMGVRADMTLQVARIATTRLNKAPRPLRLCYAGQVLRVRGTQLRPERQFGQVGAELIGSNDATADAEVIIIGIQALQALGIGELSVDIAMPSLVSAILNDLDLDKDAENETRSALDRKDSAAVGNLTKALGDKTTTLLTDMLAATGEATSALQALAAMKLPKAAKTEFKSLNNVIDTLRAAIPDLKLTIDPVEGRGFEYHSGATFTFFAKGVRGELGSGGRYMANGEDATGLTLFMDTVMRATPDIERGRRIYLAPGTDWATARQLQEDGWITVAGLSNNGDNDTSEAERLGCTHVYSQGKPLEI
ncbi:MAG: ATP phosphoribosyltransferase regulatory subunit [Rhodospirillaceae bacterium]|jgi:ATP phosphoribosyltransferase regulatory subunit|nr:ATP phosphoribosyltransferase regulatory subunit [Rhodospirillaceae bacterium]MBT4219989.1 ATP phosphoribosyltransferase regulatory subunit [Rhodospirillaceae bacterium]MBT4463165.1 ATP phosphoribosyltransferase regulatory subunit [Rhodospirillaceae bacterium]MBT5013395.1 ATP phosphoribosyltransferase regulatory subunit [Rhodospirillaceae bacterium]MBT5308763.1 ATP phosphoribosyltransferase regulatory subunit [Rhodospirillaceae bacterium]